jgi:ornithine cyclodeaminase/alanine dehydrogenase-like protein (mu-crystallin family)
LPPSPSTAYSRGCPATWTASSPQKLVALFPEHDPSHLALVSVFDSETGTPQAVMDGTHITAVRTGASSTGRRSPPARSASSRKSHSSPPPAGAFELQDLDPSEAVELGEVLAGTKPGRTSDDQITVYKSTGHAVEDAAAAALVLERTRAS